MTRQTGDADGATRLPTEAELRASGLGANFEELKLLCPRREEEIGSADGDRAYYKRLRAFDQWAPKIPENVVIFLQGRVIGEHRMFLLISGTLIVGHNKGDRMVDFLTMSADGDNALIVPIADRQISEFTIKSGNNGARVSYIKKEDVVGLLNDATKAKALIRSQTSLLKGLCNRFSRYDNSTCTNLMPLAALIIDYFEKNPKNLSAFLGRLRVKAAVPSKTKVVSIQPNLLLRGRLLDFIRYSREKPEFADELFFELIKQFHQSFSRGHGDLAVSNYNSMQQHINTLQYCITRIGRVYTQIADHTTA